MNVKPCPSPEAARQACYRGALVFRRSDGSVAPVDACRPLGGDRVRALVESLWFHVDLADLAIREDR